MRKLKIDPIWAIIGVTILIVIGICIACCSSDNDSKVNVSGLAPYVSKFVDGNTTCYLYQYRSISCVRN